jgi:mono/diheme cytochrome c family protein
MTRNVWIVIAVVVVIVVIIVLAMMLKKPTSRVLPVAPPPSAAPPAPVDTARGEAIFTGTDYSKTGLTCAHCHSASKNDEVDHIFAAHSAYGMSGRGAWWVMTPEQLTAKKGEAATLSDAANRCIAAPYMANAGKPLSPEDAEALTVYLTSIYDAQAKDSAPFLIAKALSVPPGGLTPDKTNGQRIYDTSCSQCHGVVDTVPRLEEKKFELNVVQIMAKVRGLADWETTYKTANYSVGQEPSGGPVTWLLYGMRAYAQEGAPPEAAPPAANPPAGGEGAAPGPSGAGGEAEAASPFAENSMPWYATDILSDQDVVDVAFYIFQDLGAPEPAPTPAK